MRLLKKKHKIVNPKNFLEVLKAFKTVHELDPIENEEIPFDPETKSFAEINDFINFTTSEKKNLQEIPVLHRRMSENLNEQNTAEKNDTFSLNELESRSQDHFSFNKRNRGFSFDLEKTSQIMSSLSISDQMLMEANKILTGISFYPYSNFNENKTPRKKTN